MQVSTDSTFMDVTFLDIVFRAGGVIDTQRRIMHFVPGRKYFWRIRMLFENSESPWSDTWSFATSIEETPRVA